MSIKKSIRILLILTSMIPVILLTLASYALITDKLITTNTKNLKQIAVTNINVLHSMIEAKKSEISLLAIQQILIEAAKQSNITNESAPKAVDYFLIEKSHQLKNCTNLTLYNKNYTIIASTTSNIVNNSRLPEAAPTKIPSEVAISKLKPIKTSGKTLHTFDISSPLIDTKTKDITGYIKCTIETSYFYDFFHSIQIGKTGYGILLDEDGVILYHKDGNLIGKNINSERLSKIIHKYHNNQVQLSGDFNYTYHNIEQAYGYCILPDLNWILYVKQDISELCSVVTILLPLLSISCCILLVIVIIFSSVLAKRYSAPIIALRDAMRKASDGDLTIQSNIKSNNEIGELSKNFNKMLHIIKTNYDDLESMHEELLSNEEQLRTNYDHIEFLAYHDTLTNLPNKLAFLDYVTAALSSAKKDQCIHAVYFVDLDNFKTVNDTLGHEYGDSLLVQTASILTSILGSGGMLARAGGDEFLLFKENIGTKEDAVAFASQIINYFRHPLDLEGKLVYVSMSIGIAIYPENGLSPNVLIKNSDIAMYKSKDTGKNKFTLFDKKMEEELNRNTLIIEILRTAIETQEVYIQYQPLYELKTNNIIGYEALMRIQSKKLGKLSPAEFIPIAEESGLITDLSSWLIREACRFNKNLIDLGAVPRPVSVNISSTQINRPGFVALLSEILSETQLPPQYLELEITESTLVSSIMDAAKLLKSLQSIGVRVSLDDFGTGYSSLNYLTKLPINTLKIDKSFIDNICNSKKDSSIAESIIQLAHRLDIRVVAEGVEQNDQLLLLKSQRCDIVQGFIYSRPLYPNDFLDLIREDDQIIQCSII